MDEFEDRLASDNIEDAEASATRPSATDKKVGGKYLMATWPRHFAELAHDKCYT